MGDFHSNGGMQQETRSLDPTLLEPFLKQAVDRNEAETILIGAKEAKEQVLGAIRLKESNVEPTSQDDDSTSKYKQVLEQLKVPSTSELFSQSPDQSILILDQTIMYLTREQFQQTASIPNPEPTIDESVAVVTASLISEQPSTSKSTPKSDSILPERKSLTKVSLKDAVTDSPTAEATTSEKRRASVVLLAPPTTEQPESKRKPPPVLKSIPLRKGQPLSSDSQPKSRPSVTFSTQVTGPRSLPSAKFEFDNDYSSLKLAGMNGIPSNKMPLPKRPQSQHISPYDMFNLKRENLIGRTTAMALNAKASRSLVTAASRLTGGINARFDSDYEKGWASLPTSRMSTTAPLQFVEIHVPAVSTNTTTTDENNVFPHIHNHARTHSPPPPTVPPPTATQPTRPELDATLVQAITDYHTALAQTRYPKPPTTYDTSSLDTASTPLKYTIRRQSSPNRAILDAETERRKMQSACEALGGGAGPPSEKVKALIEEFTRTEHGSTSSSRSGKLPGIPHSRKTVRTSPADVGGAEKSHHHHGRLYLSTHGDRSWRFTALPSISQ
ncbi:hypothetical protein HDU79_004111 [Rhizoclosmatium sp. JEL0117]|nr:hypothetical protein HDU79_004111 [Rhizoclosmatium sp. JEL0117]